MPQISIYVNDAQMNRISESAKREGKSISKWVVSKVLPEADNSDRNALLMELFGSVKDDTFREPGELSFSDDAGREVL